MTKTFRIASAFILLLVGGCSPGGVLIHRLEIVIPATVQSIPSGTLHAHVWAYDPYLADGSAYIAEHREIEFSHEQGKATQRDVLLTASYGDGDRTYITVEGCGNTIEGPQRMLSDGHPDDRTPPRIVMQWITNHVPCRF